MQLTRAEFDARYAAGTLKVAFIGMSNIGKSYTAMRLATKYDFSLIEVDKIIWENLGHDSMDAFAEWQGHPYTEGYKEREKHSISLETEATRKALQTTFRNPIIDTTGSIIYIDAAVQVALKGDFYTVYIEASGDDIDNLKSLYFKSPKPLVWGDAYSKRSGETLEESILRSYPKLLKMRALRYKNLSDKTIPSKLLIEAKSAKDILEALKPAL